jgi:hypothetical protein
LISIVAFFVYSSSFMRNIPVLSGLKGGKTKGQKESPSSCLNISPWMKT